MPKVDLEVRNFKYLLTWLLLHLIAPLASGPSPSSVGTPRSGNAIKPFFARQFYITGGSVAVAARGCICWVALDDAVLWQDHLSAPHGSPCYPSLVCHVQTSNC